MALFRKSVARPEPGSGAPKPKDGMATVVYAADILSFPPSDENGVRMQGNITMKPGFKFHQLYLTDESQKASHSIDGEADAEGFLKKFEGSHPGDSAEVNEFEQNTIGQGVIIIYPTDCGANSNKVIGTPCNPLYLKGEFTDDKEGVKHMFNFEQRKRDKNVAKIYTGSMAFAENFAAALALDLTPANGYGYQLPANDAADDITVAAMTHPSRKTLSIIGGGGEDPAILSGGSSGPVTVLLENGTQWIAYKNAVINLMVVDAGATTYLIEMSRS